MDHTLIVILVCLAAFILGAAMVCAITGIYVNTLLGDGHVRSGNLPAKRSAWFNLYCLRQIKNLKRQRDFYLAQAREKTEDLEEEKSVSLASQRENGDLKDKLADRERQIRELNRIIRGTPEREGFDDKERQPSKSFGRNTETAPTGKVVIYFGIPDSDGNFSEEKGSPEPDDRKLYRIVYDRKGENGELHYIPGQSDPKAIDNIDYYLIPVCEVENIPDRGFATKVMQKEPGKVVLISGKWVCDKKIKVKLI